MKSHGIAPNAASVRPAPLSRTKIESRDSSSSFSSSSATPLAKKRKTDAFLEENTADDDEEMLGGQVKSENGTAAVKDEEQQTQASMGQLSLDEAANLMQYYDTPTTKYGDSGVDMGSSSLGVHMAVEETYSSNGFVGDAGGYGSSTAGSYGMHAQDSFDFSAPYGGSGMSNIPRSGSQSLQYHPVMQYSSDQTQGCSESPLIVE